jgi:RNA polymerase sigma factor (sigma-70 family)
MEDARAVPRVGLPEVGMIEQERRITDAVERERDRLRSFVRRRLPNESDVEDVLQDVFCELVQLYRLTTPVRNVGAWLFRVARNRITDILRKRRPEPFSELPLRTAEDGEPLTLEDLLPSPHAGPAAAYARKVLVEELDAALEELPGPQREVFIAHEIEGYTFKELSRRTGAGVNTLLARKHSAVLHLRERLREIYAELLEREGTRT